MACKGVISPFLLLLVNYPVDASPNISFVKDQFVHDFTDILGSSQSEVSVQPQQVLANSSQVSAAFAVHFSALLVLH